MKQMLLATIIVVFVIASSACKKEDSLKAQPIELHFQTGISDNNIDFPRLKAIKQIYIDAAANFHKLNPQITVILDGSTEGYIQQLEGDKPPDIIASGTGSILQTVAKEGLLRDLQSLQNDSKSTKIDIPQQILDTGEINGELLVLPIEASVDTAFYYNKDLFNTLHIPHPQSDWTWDQFKDLSLQIKPSISQDISLTGGPSIAYDLPSLEALMESSGHSLLSPDGSTFVGYLDSAETIQNLNWLNDYYHAKGISSLGEDLNLFGQFDGHKIAMILILGQATFSTFQGDNLDKLGILPLPHFAGEKRAVPVSFSGFAISQKSKHADAAWSFIDYLTLEKNEDSLKYARIILTTSQSIAEAVGQDKDPDKSVENEELNYAVKSAFSISPYFFQVLTNADLTAGFQKLLTLNRSDLASALHNLALKADQELNKLKLADEQKAAASPSP